MREKELREHADCSICGKGIGAAGVPPFWRIKIKRFGLDLMALQRQQGLTMILGGHAQLAQVMSPDEDMAKPIMDPVTLTVCETCACDKSMPVAMLAEIAARVVPEDQ